MKKILTIILILAAFSATSQVVTKASYGTKDMEARYINSSLYKLNGVSLAPKLYYQKSIDTLNKNLSTGLLKLTTGTGKLSIITDNSSNWNTAYGWGNWASNFGTTSGKIAQGNDSRINNGQTAYGWGNHANLYKGKADSVNLSGYATQYDLTQHSSSQWTTSVSDIYYNSGNVGIGTNTPAYKLQVDGITLLQMPLNTANAFRLEGEDKYITCNTGSAGKTIIFDEAGLGLKVGINTTPTTTLGVNGTSLFMMPENTISAFRITGPVSEDDYLSFHTGTAGKYILFDETNQGVNIGVSKTPLYKLDIDGDVNISTGHNFKINGVNISNYPSQWITSGSNIYFTGGSVGIGVDPPLNDFHIKSSQPTIRLAEQENDNYFNILVTNDDGDFKIGNATYQNSIVVDQITGNVGIGKDPSFKLDIDGTLRTQLIRTDTIRVDAANELNVIGGSRQVLAANKNFVIYSEDIADTLIDIHNDRVILGEDGVYIGINNKEPAYSLDVVGASKIDGNIICTSSITVGGDSNSATIANVGAIRYRVSGNNSYCEMVMQTGASTYAWVVIKTNTW